MPSAVSREEQSTCSQGCCEEVRCLQRLSAQRLVQGSLGKCSWLSPSPMGPTPPPHPVLLLLPRPLLDAVIRVVHKWGLMD